MGWLNALAVLQARVSQHELSGLPESTTGWIFSTYAFLMFSCGVQVGPCFEPPIQTRQLQPGGGALTAGRVGPIFDAYNVKLLIVPGSMGMVVMAMILSICKGSSRPPPFSSSAHHGNFDTALIRILPILPDILRPRRALGLAPLQPLHRNNRPVVRQAARAGDGRRLHGRRHRRHRLPARHPVRRAARRVRLVRPHRRPHLRRLRPLRLPPRQEAPAAQQDGRRADGLWRPARSQVRPGHAGRLPRRARRPHSLHVHLFVRAARRVRVAHGALDELAAQRWRDSGQGPAGLRGRSLWGLQQLLGDGGGLRSQYIFIVVHRRGWSDGCDFVHGPVWVLVRRHDCAYTRVRE